MRDQIEKWEGPADYWSPEIVSIIRNIEKFIKENRGKTPPGHYPGAAKYAGWILQYCIDNNISQSTHPDFYKMRHYFEYKYSKG